MINNLQQHTSYEALYADSMAYVQDALDHHLSPDADTTGNKTIPGAELLWEALRYSVLDGGKRIRPILALEVCKACDGDTAAILPTACAIELVHAQSLIHDDLPCMDNDDLRRGKPTLHKAFCEAMAVLTGDALLAMAFGLISGHTPITSRTSADAVLSVVSDFARVASVEGLVNGQWVDIYYEDRPYTQEVLEYIHTYKTGALFKFSARAGACLAGASPQTVEAFSSWGQKLGLAYQIVDDLLDIQSSSEILGKTAGKDQIQKKATYPSLYGETEARNKADALLEECLAILEALAKEGIRIDRLKPLVYFIRERIH